MNKNRHWHFVGVGGIGMSALAQMARAQGITVSGSDRAADHPENAAVFGALRAQGVRIYPQDGSFIGDGVPDTIIYSTAIENDNPDFAVTPATVGRLHRAAALKYLIERSSATPTVAVAGSCGKTSTTAMLAETLLAAGRDVECVNGGLVKSFVRPTLAGNYRPGRDILVFEADESDKSLLTFTPDYAIVLNIGTDHYDKDELTAMFARFVNQARRGAVLESAVAERLSGLLRPGLELAIFDGSMTPRKSSAYADYLSGYRIENSRSIAEINGQFELVLPSPGRHTALNLLAIRGLLGLLGIAGTPEILMCAQGVKRRFEFAGRHARTDAAIYDDYAHNPEKIACALQAAQELVAAVGGQVWAIFQPHGYGPFGFMAPELGHVLSQRLRAVDHFLLLEPYYAGGTSSFKPTATEVLASWREQNHAEAAHDRATVTARLAQETTAKDVILIMGARDNTLGQWAQQLAE